MRLPARMGSASICTTLHCPGSGRYLVYGKFVPTMNRVSQPSMASMAGAVPKSPMPPMQSGWSSGITAFPGSVLTTGLPRRSAVCNTSSRAPERSGADEHDHFGAGVEHLCRRQDILLAGQARSWQIDGRRRLIDRRCGGAPRVGSGLGDLDVGGNGQMSDTPAGQGMADRDVDERGNCAGTWIISLYSATSMNSFSSATSCW